MTIKNNYENRIINCKTNELEIRDLTFEEETKYNQDIIKAKELEEVFIAKTGISDYKKAFGTKV